MITKTIQKCEQELTTTINELNKEILENLGEDKEVNRTSLRTIRDSIINTYCLIQELKLKGVI